MNTKFPNTKGGATWENWASVKGATWEDWASVKGTSCEN